MIREQGPRWWDGDPPGSSWGCTILWGVRILLAIAALGLAYVGAMTVAFGQDHLLRELEPGQVAYGWVLTEGGDPVYGPRMILFHNEMGCKAAVAMAFEQGIPAWCEAILVAGGCYADDPKGIEQAE